jgi:hypothetical protein
MRSPEELLEEARRTVANQSRSQVNRESAWKWAALAVAACERKLLGDAVDYHHEAVEHAALADPSGQLLTAVRAWVCRYVPAGALE